ncbi:hypothetical protein DMNBHIDG_02596 [Candidatus Methanoperedenaceae archaeon GB37]|nr:hypothetical protein DMNBHIDG_02596 [Candidatus Methanoperedenaceae archaeon GB37]
MLNSPVCVDASFVIRLLESVDSQSSAIRLWIEWHEAGRPVVAPSLLYYEITNALHRYVVHGELLPEEASELLDVALKLDITLYGDADLHRYALKLAKSFSLPTTYDAHYLALAERLGAEFWTTDKRLVRTVQKVTSWVRLLKEKK